ncbi:MAG: SAM-dependent methyltransferase [Henriciella sp.]|nr:SAM-dependent methyltransferase [Henriciella sp.]
MTTLKDRLKSMIQASGPLSVATYMDLCLHDRRHGYYATRPGLGEDFITAPEISQVFGELIGLWAANEWQMMGAPSRIALVEIGPGRGTLMADALRATRAVSGFHTAIDLAFIEASPVLRANLEQRFAEMTPRVLSDLDALPTEHPVILIANEWLDCLPVTQYVRVGDAWHERVIGLDEAGALKFGLDPATLPEDISPTQDQAVIELQPGLKTVSETLSQLFSATPGRALFVDYGPADRTPDDTLRSFKAGTQIDPLAAPGESDLTCDVDFARLVRLLRQQGLQTEGPIAQGLFLQSLGAEARLNQLARQNPDAADTLYQGVVKLVDPAQMGTRFQVVSVASAR